MVAPTLKNGGGANAASALPLVPPPLVLLATFARLLTSITLVRLSWCQVKRFSLRIKVSKFLKFSNKTSRWDHFMGQPVEQIAYTCCIHFTKTEFRVPNIVRYDWKIHSRSVSQDAVNSIRRSTNDGERATEPR